MNLQFAYGSTIGSKHRRAGINNQDSYKLVGDDKLFAAVVCDGCSKNGDVFADTEVGSSLFARWTGKSIGAFFQPKYIRLYIFLSKKPFHAKKN